jgi:hypothetical protein
LLEIFGNFGRDRIARRIYRGKILGSALSEILAETELLGGFIGGKKVHKIG